jgi:hypothetical protein
MLMVSSYAKDHVDACRANVAAQLASYRSVLAAKPAEIDAFERQFFNHIILALDHCSFTGPAPRPRPERGGSQARLGEFPWW